MRKILSLFCLGIALPLQAEPRLAVVDYKKIIDNYSQAKVVAEAFKSAQVQLKEELQTKWDSFQKLLNQAARLQKEVNDPILPQPQRFQKHQEFKSLELKIENEKKALREFKVSREKKFQEHYLTESEKVIKEIAQTTAQLAREKGYDLVLNNSDVTSHATALVQYFPVENDITMQLLERLNKK